MEAGQVVIITGGARGIGFGIGQCFAAKQAKIAVADLDAEAAEKAAQDLVGKGASDGMGVACNVTDRASVNAMVAAVLERFGRIDVLVNNAGVCPFVDVMEISEATWQQTIDVNLTGPFHCTQEVAKHMIERGGGGRVVFITSLAENITNANQVDYAASKSGVRMAMAGFAVALGPHGINCNAVAPGHVSTPMVNYFWDTPAGKERAKEIIPLGRGAQTTDIGDAVVYLASKESSYVNGITLRVDGGCAVKG